MQQRITRRALFTLLAVLVLDSLMTGSQALGAELYTRTSQPTALDGIELREPTQLTTTTRTLEVTPAYPAPADPSQTDPTQPYQPGNPIDRDYCVGADGKISFCTSEPADPVDFPKQVVVPRESSHPAGSCALELVARGLFDADELVDPIDWTGRWTGTQFAFPVVDPNPFDNVHPILPEPLVVHYDRDLRKWDPLSLDPPCASFDGETVCYDQHVGTDYLLGGGFAAQLQGVTVTAGAGGIVTKVRDADFDLCHAAVDLDDPDRVLGNDCGEEDGEERDILNNLIEICHPDGTLSRYLHIRQGSALVVENQRVSCGQSIAQVGSAGNSATPHLHFEVAVHESLSEGHPGNGKDRHLRTDYVYIDPYELSDVDSLWVQQNGGSPGTLPGTTCQ